MMTSCTIDTDLLIAEPAELYHARSREFLTSHQLLDFRRCPLLHFKKRAGLIAESESTAMLVGQAAHVRILEGRDCFRERFAFGGPINPTTGRPFGPASKAFAAWAAVQEKPILSSEQVALVENLAAGVAMNSHAVELLVEGVAEGVVRAEYCEVPCQARLDWVHPHRGIVDLKTADDLTWFEPDARRFGYIHQLAFYQAVLAAVLGGELVPVHLIAVEKREPHRAGVWQITEATLEQARAENEAAIERLKSCRDRNSFPTGYEEVRLLDFP